MNVEEQKLLDKMKAADDEKVPVGNKIEMVICDFPIQDAVNHYPIILQCRSQNEDKSKEREFIIPAEKIKSWHTDEYFEKVKLKASFYDTIDLYESEGNPMDLDTYITPENPFLENGYPALFKSIYR